MPSGGEACAGGEVAGLRGQEDGLGGGHDTTHTQLGVHEASTHEVHTVVSRVGARVGGIRKGLRGEAFKVKERVRKVIEAIRDTSSSSLRDKNNVGSIMQEGGTQVESTGAVLVPRLPLDGRVVDDDQLAWGMGGVGGEVDGGTVDSVPCGFGGVWGKATQVVEGKFSGGEQVRPTIGGKGYMGRREDRQEVVLGGPNGALGLVSAVVLRGNVLELGRGLGG
jgi:hypothetical protein